MKQDSQSIGDIQILIDALKFYANPNHWMPISENGHQTVLCAQPESTIDAGWKHAHGKLQQYAVSIPASYD